MTLEKEERNSEGFVSCGSVLLSGVHNTQQGHKMIHWVAKFQVLFLIYLQEGYGSGVTWSTRGNEWRVP